MRLDIVNQTQSSVWLERIGVRTEDGTWQDLADTGAFVWRDLKGFHVRFTSHSGSSRYHGKVPVSGSLYTLLLVCLPFFRRTKRIWLLVIMTQVAIFIWYWIHHQEIPILNS